MALGSCQLRWKFNIADILIIVYLYLFPSDYLSMIWGFESDVTYLIENGIPKSKVKLLS